MGLTAKIRKAIWLGKWPEVQSWRSLGFPRSFVRHNCPDIPCFFPEEQANQTNSWTRFPTKQVLKPRLGGWLHWSSDLQISPEAEGTKSNHKKMVIIRIPIQLLEFCSQTPMSSNADSLQVLPLSFGLISHELCFIDLLKFSGYLRKRKPSQRTVGKTGVKYTMLEIHHYLIFQQHYRISPLQMYDIPSEQKQFKN